jgi:hypothetical protein
VLNRQKRSNAGKALQRFDNDTPPPPPPVAASTKAPSQPQKASVVSQGSRASRALHTPMRKPSLEPTHAVSLHDSDSVTTDSPSPTDDELGREKEQEEEQEEEQKEEEQEEGNKPTKKPTEEEADKTPEVENTPYSLETSVVLGKKAIYYIYTSSASFNFDKFSDSARQRASEAANKLKKSAECIIFKASVKTGTQKPRLFTIEHAIE